MVVTPYTFNVLPKIHIILPKVHHSPSGVGVVVVVVAAPVVVVVVVVVVCHEKIRCKIDFS